MQSGISASQSLVDAFTTFSSDTGLFCLPVTIESEALVPLEAVPFANHPHDSEEKLASSLPSLSKHLEEKTPIYLLVRPSPSPTTLLTAITYVPSTSPVRAKTLFASTRQTLTRSLGLDKFGDSVFVTDVYEVTDPAEWAARARAKGQHHSEHSHHHRHHHHHDDYQYDLLSTQELELLRVKRAEEEERHGTSGVQLSGRSHDSGSGAGSGSRGLVAHATEEAREALASLSSSSSSNPELVQLGLDQSSETLVLLVKHSNVTPEQVQGRIPSDRPTYNLYRYGGAGGAESDGGPVLFIYVCPGTSKVRERMVYASNRNGVLERAKAEGVEVAKRLELDVDDITAERLAEEAGFGAGAGAGAGARIPTSGGGSGGRFSRPKRPGRR